MKGSRKHTEVKEMTCPECKKSPIAMMGGAAFLDGLCGGCWGAKIIKEESKKGESK